MKPRNRIITSLNKLIQDAKDAEASFDAKRVKRNLAAAIEQYGEWVETSSQAASDATYMLSELTPLTGEKFEARVNEFIEWFTSEIVNNRADRQAHLIKLAASKLGYKALTDLLS